MSSLTPNRSHGDLNTLNTKPDSNESYHSILTLNTLNIPLYILDDLCSRFIINIPEEERQDLIRIFFQIELAHWFYLDFYCQDHPELKACGIKEFSGQIFQHCPILTDHARDVDRIRDTWREYKMAVPTFGAILLDTTLQHVLLVQGFWSKSSWGFPKGKVNKEEQAEECGIREVLEETGYNIRDRLDLEEYIEYKMHEQLTRLYLIPNVPMDTSFAPRTRKEIRKLEWFRIDTLPSHKRDTVCVQHHKLNPNAFFMVIPFIKPLKKWIAQRQGEEQHDSDHHAGSQYKAGRTPREHSRETTRDQTQSSEKPRSRQRPIFGQAIQDTFQDYANRQQPTRDNKDRSRSNKEQRTRSASPPTTQQSFQKMKQQTQSPKSARKQMQILKRDGTVTTGPRRSLATQFTVPSNQSGGKGQSTGTKQKTHSTNMPKPTFKAHFPEAWANFKIDIDAVMKAFVGAS